MSNPEYSKSNERLPTRLPRWRKTVDFEMLLVVFAMILSCLHGTTLSETYSNQEAELSAPLQFLRTHSLDIIELILILLCIRKFYSLINTRTHLSWAVLLYVLYNLVNCAVAGYYGVVPSDKCFYSATAFCAWGFYFGFAAVKPISVVEDHFAALLTLNFLLFAFGSMLESVLSLDSVMWLGRFSGISVHPNFCGIISTLSALAATHILLRPGAPKFWKASAIFAIISGIGFIIASGSRMAVMVFAVGFYLSVWKLLRRQKLFVRSLPIIILVVFGMFLAKYMLDDNESPQDLRILSLENTRADPWLRMWSNFVKHPLFGDMRGGVEALGENSFLQAASTTGIVGLIPLLGSVAFLICDALRCLREGGKNFNGLNIAGIAIALVVCATLEGYMNSLVTFHTMAYLIVASSMAGINWRK